MKYIEVLDHKLIFYTNEDKYETFDTLNKYAEMLKNNYFELCTRCYLVNLKAEHSVLTDAQVENNSSASNGQNVGWVNVGSKLTYTIESKVDAKVSMRINGAKECGGEPYNVSNLLSVTHNDTLATIATGNQYRPNGTWASFKEFYVQI